MEENASQVDAMLFDHERLNAFIYTPLETALSELVKRKQDTELQSYVNELIPSGIPNIMSEKQSVVIFRNIATPNYEVTRFMHIAVSLQELQPVIFEYTQDKFNNRNEWKFSLAKVPFYTGVNKNNEQLFEYQNIIDVNASNNKPINSINTVWGQNLVEFHHELFNMSYPEYTNVPYDLSEWLHSIGPAAKDYYKSFLALFLKDGILFENFLIDEKEFEFTKNIILPAIQELEKETGHKPLIVALEPTDIEGNKFWLSHPLKRKELFAEKMLQKK